MSQITDKELLDLFQNPETEKQGFNLIVRNFQERIYWHVRKIVISHDDANDVVQNTFIKALNQLKGYATILTVAHRLSNVQDANVVYVIRDGMVVESGSIDELILLNGYFVKMYNSELGLKGK